MKRLTDDDPFVRRTKNGGLLKVTDSRRDSLNRCQFVIEREDKTPHCSKCGLRPGEGYPVACGDGPKCAALKHSPKGQAVCGGEISTHRAQMFFAVPETYLPDATA